MKYTVFDTADDCTSKIAALKKAGITAIIRPSQNPNSWKQIGGPEYNAILAAGMAIGIVSQWVNNHLGYFNAISGKRDGDYSVHRAQLRNQPKGTAEPPRVRRRPFGLSHAAMAGCSSMA